MSMLEQQDDRSEINKGIADRTLEILMKIYNIFKFSKIGVWLSKISLVA